MKPSGNQCEDASEEVPTLCLEVLCSPILMENVISILSELFHICSKKHLGKLDKVAVVLIIDNLNNTPWISATTNLLTVWSINKFV